ncbi:MAG: hypothetical protein J5I81_06315 [Nitrococcus mobilis]|nr:hypothetical protein [Nitrococcus mobilis]
MTKRNKDEQLALDCTYEFGQLVDDMLERRIPQEIIGRSITQAMLVVALESSGRALTINWLRGLADRLESEIQND